jgi:hypothetical protein
MGGVHWFLCDVGQKTFNSRVAFAAGLNEGARH